MEWDHPKEGAAAPGHHTETIHPDKSYLARCSCGWVSKPFPTRKKADEDATEHVVIVTRYAD